MSLYSRILTSGGEVQRDAIVKDASGTTTFPIATGVDYKITKGNDIENFHAKKKRGDLLPYTLFYQRETKGAGEYYHSIAHVSNGYWQTWENGLLKSVDCSQAEIDSLILGHDSDLEYYVQAAASTIYSQGWDALTFIAEFGKVKDMFRGAVKRLIRLSSKGDLAKIQLELRYGWRTLWYDMVDITEAIQSLNDKRDRFQQRVGGNISNQYNHTEVMSSGGGVVLYTLTTKHTIEVSLRGNVIADITPPKFAFNPITTGYELITLSFVADWFVNIGQWLEAMSFVVMSQKHYAAAGIKVNYVKDYSISDLNWDPSYTGTVTYTAKSITDINVRTPMTVSKFPLQKVRLNADKIEDLWALLKTSFRDVPARI